MRRSSSHQRRTRRARALTRLPRAHVAGPWSLCFSHDAEEQYLFVTNGITGHVNVYDRRSLRKLSHFGESAFGRDGPPPPGAFKLVHSIGTDSQGNLYVTETGGMPARVQKFVRV